MHGIAQQKTGVLHEDTLTLVGGPERSVGTGGNVRALPGRAMRVTGGEPAVDGRPIENLGQIETDVQKLQPRSSIAFGHSTQSLYVLQTLFIEFAY